MFEFDELLIKRSHYLGYQLTEEEENSLGWIGGNAPEWFKDKEDLLTDDAGNIYGFFLSIKLPVSDNMLSVFIPERFSVYEQRQYPCGIKVFEHPASVECKSRFHLLMPEKPQPGEKLTAYQKRMDYSLPVIKKANIGLPTKHPVDSRPFEDFIQFGGTPAWIQHNEEHYAGDILKSGYQYIMQINEDQYLPDMIHGNYPFCFGALYIYGQIKESTLSNPVAAFWQDS